MEIQYFISTLWKRKWLIIAAVVVAAGVTYWWVSKKPAIYKASVTLSTGIIDYKGVDAEEGLPFLQKFQVDINFGNLIEFIQSRPNLRFLSYRLLMHDLLEEANGGKPFRLLEPEQKMEFDQNDLVTFPTVLKRQLDSLKIEFRHKDHEELFKKLTDAYDYKGENIQRWNLSVSRLGATDILKIEYLSEIPELSAFAVNNFCTDLLRNRKKLKTADAAEKVDFLKELVDDKKAFIDNKKSKLRQFKEGKELVALDAQQEATVSHIKELEIQLEESRKDIPAIKQAITRLDQFLGKEKVALIDGKSEEANERIISSKQAITALERKLALKDFNSPDEQADLKKQLAQFRVEEQLAVERLAETLSQESYLESLSDTDKQLLVERLKKEFDLIAAQETVKAYEVELERLHKRAFSFVSAESFIKNVQDEIDYAQKEYGSLLNKLADAEVSLEKSYQPLTILEMAQVPEEPESSKKLFFVVFAGAVSGGMVAGILLLLVLIDASLSTPDHYKRHVDFPLIGSFPIVKTKKLDLPNLFESNGKVGNKLEWFRENLRKLRFHLTESGSQVFVFVSNRKNSGKTFLALNLAYALSEMGKRVLLIDTNFKNRSLSEMKSEQALEEGKGEEESKALAISNEFSDDFNWGEIKSAFHDRPFTIIANKGTLKSPAEVFAGKDFHHLLDELKTYFDVIFLEAPAINDYSDVRELIPYGDKVIVVFEASHQLKNADKATIEYLRSMEDKVLGGVLNKIKLSDLT